MYYRLFLSSLPLLLVLLTLCVVQVRPVEGACYVNSLRECGTDSGSCSKVCEPVDGGDCGNRYYKKLIPTTRDAAAGEAGRCDQDVNAGTTECQKKTKCHAAGDPCVVGTDGIERRMCVAIGTSTNIIPVIFDAASGDDCTG